MTENDCQIKTLVSFGRYVWCGNMSSPTGSGMTLSNVDSNILDPGAKYVGGIYGDINSYLVTFIIQMNQPLAQKTTNIEIFLPNGFLFGYNVRPIINGVWTVSRKISPQLLNQTVTIKFGRYSQLPEEKCHLRRARLEPIFETKVTILEPKQYEQEICTICTEKVDNISNKYLSHCGHLFHLNCLFEYLKNIDKLYEIHPYCLNSCCRSPKIKPFNCPNCRQLIENSSVVEL